MVHIPPQSGLAKDEPFLLISLVDKRRGESGWVWAVLLVHQVAGELVTSFAYWCEIGVMTWTQH